MLMQAGILLTDIRFFDLQLRRHFGFLRDGVKLDDAEIGIFLSQTALLLSHFAGTLSEANNVIRKSFYSTAVSKKYAHSLPQEASRALARIKAYFAKPNNLVSTFRNKFAFHYDRDEILEIIGDLPANWEHRSYVTDCVNEAFMEFGQVCSTHSLCKSTGKANMVEGLFHAYGEIGGTLVKAFLVFLHGVISVICNNISRESNRTAITISETSPALFLHQSASK